MFIELLPSFGMKENFLWPWAQDCENRMYMNKQTLHSMARVGLGFDHILLLWHPWHDWLCVLYFFSAGWKAVPSKGHKAFIIWPMATSNTSSCLATSHIHHSPPKPSTGYPKPHTSYRSTVLYHYHVSLTLYVGFLCLKQICPLLVNPYSPSNTQHQHKLLGTSIHSSPQRLG